MSSGTRWCSLSFVRCAASTSPWCASLRATLLLQLFVRDMAVGEEVHKNVFDGARAVTWLVGKRLPDVESRADATRVFQRLLAEGLIEPLTRSEASAAFVDAVALYSLKRGTAPDGRRDTLRLLKERLEEEVAPRHTMGTR